MHHSQQFLLCRIANSPRWIIYHSLQCLLVRRVYYQSQIGYNILYLFTLIERQPTVYFIRNTALSQCLLQHTALRICSIQHRNIFISCILILHHMLNIFRHSISLLKVAIRTHYLNRLAYRQFAIHRLRYLISILSNQRVSCIHNRLCRPIILL